MPIAFTRQDAVLDALDMVVEVLTRNVDWMKEVIEQAAAVRKERVRGHSYRTILEDGDVTLIVARLPITLAAIEKAGRRLRIAEAHALRAEGMTIAWIAELFGISAQRVSVLLHAPPASSDADESTHRIAPSAR